MRMAEGRSVIPRSGREPRPGFVARAVANWLAKAQPPALTPPMTSSSGMGGWWPLVREPFTGAWQRNIAIDYASVLANPTLFACQTLIASDVAKLRVKLVRFIDTDAIWEEVTSAAFSPVLRKPNHFQTRIQLWESWMLSKLSRGNAYVLKERDDRGVVVGLYVLDPMRVRPLVSDSGDVFYQVSTDNLAGLKEQGVPIPAREIIHDRWNCLFHPLCGLSPIFAAGLAATQGLRIQNNSARFFGNDSKPGGILTAPGRIGDDVAKRLKGDWETNFGGDNVGRVAVLGDGLKYESVAVNAENAQLIEQLKWSSETVCSCFHVPPYKVGVGSMPTYNNIQSLNVEYYSQCLQRLIEDAELCLDEGLGLGADGAGNGLGTEFDLDGLLRMDSVTQMTVLKEAIGAAVYSPNEARQKVDKRRVEGGASPMAQQQNYSLAALAKRDAKEDPFGKDAPAPPPQPAPPSADDDEAGDEETRALVAELALRKGLRPLLAA